MQTISAEKLLTIILRGENPEESFTLNHLINSTFTEDEKMESRFYGSKSSEEIKEYLSWIISKYSSLDLINSDTGEVVAIIDFHNFKDEEFPEYNICEDKVETYLYK